MDASKRILTEKMKDGQHGSPELPGQQREAEIDAALASLSITAGPAPLRERVLAAAIAEANTCTEKNMNLIIRLLSGRSWPTRLAIISGVILAIVLLAQLPFRTSYARSSGQALVFDLGVAASAQEASQTRDRWAWQSQRLLDCFRAINASAHRVGFMSDPLSDNLLGLSGVIYVMDDAEAQDYAEDQERHAEDQAGYEQQMLELEAELKLLSSGVDNYSREELARARGELLLARDQLLSVMANRDSKLTEASSLLERHLQQQPNSAREQALVQLKARLLAEGSSGCLSDEQVAGLRARIRELIGNGTPDLSSLDIRLDELHDLAALDSLDAMRDLQEASLQLDLTARELADMQNEPGNAGYLQMQKELTDAREGLLSLDGLREEALAQLQSEELHLKALQEGMSGLQSQDLEKLQLELKLVLPDMPTAELELEMSQLKLDLDREMQVLQELELPRMQLELQALAELSGELLELQLPDAELLKVTELDRRRELADTDKISFRHQNHLFSFPRSASAATMTAVVREWLAANEFDDDVQVELCYDDAGKLCGARVIAN
jgi:hypothetical protein